VPLVGTTVLGYLFGVASAVPIAVAALVMNLVQVPVSLVFLSIGTAASDGPVTGLGAHIRAAVREPVMWAELLGL
jgi:malonate transporter